MVGLPPLRQPADQLFHWSNQQRFFFIISDVRVNTTRRGRAANSSPQPKQWNNVSRCSSSLQVRRTCCSWACTTPSQTTVPCCPPGRRVQRGRRRGSTSAVITWWATKLCAGTPSNSSTSKYSGLANNHCSIAGGG